MPIAAATTSYPLLNIFWTMFEFFALVVWIWLLIYVCTDIFGNRDLSGGAKALWLLFVFFIPLIGVLVYLIAHGGDMHERTQQRASRPNGQARGYAPADPVTPASPASTADQLQGLADARDRGTITAQEFDREKAKILA